MVASSFHLSHSLGEGRWVTWKFLDFLVMSSSCLTDSPWSRRLFMAGVFIGAGVHGVVFWAAGVLVCPHDGWSLGFDSF